MTDRWIERGWERMGGTKRLFDMWLHKHGMYARCATLKNPCFSEEFGFKALIKALLVRAYTSFSEVIDGRREVTVTLNRPEWLSDKWDLLVNIQDVYPSVLKTHPTSDHHSSHPSGVGLGRIYSRVSTRTFFKVCRCQGLSAPRERMLRTYHPFLKLEITLEDIERETQRSRERFWSIL